jgi:phenylalanyl-tRNA synthetase beta chain
MTALGCNEITTFSFVSPKVFSKINLPEDSCLRKTVTIRNPLGEDTSVMRTTIVPSMLDILARNWNARNTQVKLFEIGKEYIPTESDKRPDENEVLCIGLYGDADFYTLKGMIEALFTSLNISGIAYAELVDCPLQIDKAFHPGRSAKILHGDNSETVLGFFGEVHPAVLENYDIAQKVYVAKLDITKLMAVSVTDIQYKPLPKYPAVTRDLSVVCDESLQVAKLENAIKSAFGKILEDITLFDVYRGAQTGEGKKSVSYAITLRSFENTLTDKQVDQGVEKALKNLSELGVTLRV